MAKTVHPNSMANLDRGNLVSTAKRRAIAAEGRAFALAWRARNKPVFDAMYGASA